MLLVECLQTENITDPVILCQTYSTQPRTLVNAPRHYLPQGQLTLPMMTQCPRQTNPVGNGIQTENGSNTHSLLGNNLLYADEIGEVLLVLQGKFESGYLLITAMGKIGYGAVLDLPIFTEGVPQKVTAIRFTALAGVGRVDVYSVYYDNTLSGIYQGRRSTLLVATSLTQNPKSSFKFHSFHHFILEDAFEDKVSHGAGSFTHWKSLPKV